MPSQWTYDFSLAGPTSTLDFHEVPADSVLHFTYAPTPNAPWLGCGPITTAILSGRLSGAVVRALGYEVAGPIGSVLGIPVDGDDPTVVALKKTLPPQRAGLRFWKQARGITRMTSALTWRKSGTALRLVLPW